MSLTAVCIRSAEHANVGCFVALILPDSFDSLTKAARVHPFLANALALEHFLLVIVIIWLHANAKALWLT